MSNLKDIAFALKASFVKQRHKPTIAVIKETIHIGSAFVLYRTPEGLVQLDRIVAPAKGIYCRVRLNEYDAVVSHVLRFYWMENKELSIENLFQLDKEKRDLFLKEDMAPSARQLVSMCRYEALAKKRLVDQECEEFIAKINEAHGTKYDSTGWWTKCGSGTRRKKTKEVK
jgi:hypothetical protein